MRPDSFQCRFQAAVTPAQAMADIGRVRDWWATDFNGTAEHVGDTFTVRFDETFVTFRVAEMGSHIVWDVLDCRLHWLENATEWTGTRVVWTVSEAGPGVEVTLTHEGLVPTIACYDDCSAGWTRFVTGSLQALMTTGKGTPA